MLSGDIVLEINGVTVNTSEEIYQAVRSSDKITMVVQRGRDLIRLQMTPEYTEWHSTYSFSFQPERQTQGQEKLGRTLKLSDRKSMEILFSHTGRVFVTLFLYLLKALRK